MEDVKFDYTGKGNTRSATLNINNECSIYNVENIYKNIQEKGKKIRITKVCVNDVSNIDLAGAQLLISLRNKLKIQTPELEFEYKISNDLKKILTNCGLIDIIQN